MLDITLTYLSILSLTVSGSPLPSNNYSTHPSPLPLQRRCRPRPQKFLHPNVLPSGVTGNFTGMKEVKVINVGPAHGHGGRQDGQPEGDGNGHQWGKGKGKWDQAKEGQGWGQPSRTGNAQTTTDYDDAQTQHKTQTQTQTQTQAQTYDNGPETSKAQPLPQTSQASGGGGDSGDGAKAMVQLHNDFRAQHGAGEVGWSDELASFAADYGSKCVFEHSGGPYGENLAAGSGDMSAAAGFKMWADEASEYNPANPQFSHFTQVVWKGTDKIGCAIIPCAAGTVFDLASNYIICEYQPAGNVGGQFAANVQ